MSSILILGAAGFIGSNLTKKFIKSGYKVIAVDGFLKHTGGNKKNIDAFIGEIDFFDKRIECMDNLVELVKSVDIIVDCMAWTSHHSALDNPFYDLDLNARSHLSLLAQIPKSLTQKFIYLGSRGQYGNPNTNLIDEDTPMAPSDIQGIHKLASESYYRVYANLKDMNVISLRFPNCYGRHQPTMGTDIGLIGGFIKNSLAGNIIEIYGKNRKRNILYVDDLVNIILKLSQKEFKGFNTYNISGVEVLLGDLAEKITSIVGKGSVLKKEMPYDIQVIDIGSAKFSDNKLKKYLGDIPLTKLGDSLSNTVNYFKETYH